MDSTKRCYFFSTHCTVCLIKEVFDFLSPFTISPIAGSCEKRGPTKPVYATTKLRIFLTVLLIAGGIGVLISCAPILCAACNRDAKECLQIVSEVLCCTLGFIAMCSNGVLPGKRINNMTAWYALMKRCRDSACCHVATSKFQAGLKRKILGFISLGIIVPVVIAAVRLVVLVKTNKFSWIRAFGIPFNVHLQLMTIFRNVVMIDFLKTLYKAVQKQTIECLKASSESYTTEIFVVSKINITKRKYSTCRRLKQLNRLYSALFLNCTDLADYIIAKFLIWFGAAIVTLIINIYSIVLLRDGEESIWHSVGLKWQTVLLMVLIILLLERLQSVHDVVSRTLL